MAYDEQGLVFAVGAERGVVKLYDARNWAAGPFTSFPVRAVGGWGGWGGGVHAAAGGLNLNLETDSTPAPACLPPRLPPCLPPPSASTRPPPPPHTHQQVKDEVDSGALFACLKFSLDGGSLLAVAEGRIYLLDSFEGHVKQKVGGARRLWRAQGPVGDCAGQPPTRPPAPAPVACRS